MDDSHPDAEEVTPIPPDRLGRVLLRPAGGELTLLHWAPGDRGRAGECEPGPARRPTVEPAGVLLGAAHV